MGTPLYKVEGIVLRKWRMGERDQVLALLTPSLGRLDLAARGSRRASASPGARLEPFMHVRVLAARGRSLDSLSQAEVLDGRRAISDDLHRLAYGTYVLELFYRVVEHGACPASPRLFSALVRSLDELEAPAAVECEFACRRAELRLLTVLGFPPQLEACVMCLEQVVPTHFSPAHGGIVCASCRGMLEGARPLSVEAWHFVRLLRSPDLAALGPARDAFEPCTFREVEHHLAAWLDWHCATPLRSRRFLAQIGKPAAKVS